MKKFKKIFIAFLAFFPFFPALALAQVTDFSSLVGVAVNVLRALVSVMFAAAVITFLAGVAMFIFKSDSEVERTKGKQIMVWGEVALFVMVSMWGLVNVIKLTFGI